jgi:XTP/dITP diphosphohydrolase
MDLLIATRNRHKVGEIRAIFSLPGLRLLAADDVGPLPDVVEDGATFEANAVLKAVAWARAAGRWTLADDSGIEVDALGGEPGVRSARYAGRQGDDAGNNRKLLSKMAGVSDRRARFRCAIALSSPAGVARTVAGACEGHVLAALRGTGGFGYDPLFVPDGHAQTFAELPAETKNRISHRAAALRRAAEAWGELLAAGATDWP